MAPLPPSGPRAPPTGPKALRNVNGIKQPPSGPSALINGSGLSSRLDKVSIAFPSSLAGQSQRTSSIGTGNGEAGPSKPKANATSTPSRPSSSTINGKAIPLSNGVGESSKQTSNSPTTPNAFRVNVPIPSGPSSLRNQSYNKLPSSTSVATTSTSTSISKSPDQPRRPPTSPKKRHTKSLSTDKPKDTTYRANFLPTDENSRAKVSISLSGLTNGIPNPKKSKLPHLSSNLPFDKSSPSGTPPPPPPSSSPPPPPNGRPPTPPLPPGERPPTPPPLDENDVQVNSRPLTPPPPDDDQLPPPPPSPPTKSPSQLPPPPPPSFPKPPSAPRAFFSSSSSSSSSRIHSSPAPPPPPIEPPPAPPSPASNPPPMPESGPPSFHFRDLPIRPKSPSEEDENEGDDTVMEPEERIPTPPPPPNSPTPPYVPPPYIPPACVKPRPGIGSFLVIKGKQRTDGIEFGVPVEVVDPRRKIAKDQLEKGRGSMKSRTGYYEVEWEWDEDSTGPKPPPPPTAVLITGLSPLTTTDQISKFLRPYGRITDIDAKMDTKSGMQLGICWVNFDGPPHGRKGTPHDVACQVVKICDGQRISLNTNEKIKVVLDGRGLRTQKAVKDEMLKRYPPKVVVPSKPTVPVSTPSLIPPTAGTSTPSSAGAQTPRAETSIPSISRTIPSIPKPLSGSLPSRPYRPLPPPPAIFDTTRHTSSLPSRPGGLPSRPLPPSSLKPIPTKPSGLPARPDTGIQHLSSAFTAAPFSRHSDHDRGGSRRYDYSDSYTPNRRPPRSRSRTPYSDYSSDYSSDSEDDHARPVYRARARAQSPYGRRRVNGRAPLQTTVQDEKAVERVKDALSSNGMAHIVIEAKSLPPMESYSNFVKDHFKAFKPSQILHNHHGWFILFSDNTSAYRAQRVLNTTAIQGHKLALIVKSPPSTAINADMKKPNGEDQPMGLGDTNGEKAAWKFLTITKKNRPAPVPTGPKADRLKAEKIRKQIIESDESSDEEEKVIVKPKKRVPSFSSASSLSDNETIIISKTIKPPAENDDMAMDIDEDSTVPITPIIKPPVMEVQQDKEETPTAKGKKRTAKPKVAKKSKKARLDSPVPTIDEPVVEILPPPEPEVAEITLDKEPEVEPEATKVVKKATGKKKGPKSDFDKFIASTVIDEEDAYWLGRALSAAKEGIEPTFAEDEEKDEMLLDETHPLYHTSGSWRAEGFKKIPQISKSSYLPQRNKATAAVEDVVGGITTGRTARLVGRDQNRQTFIPSTSTSVQDSASELFAFNQLRIRKKQLRFARSAIEGYGLYAMEIIHQGEMVCEYVGELCRAAIADVREQNYQKQGIGSSYLFRIDNDIVCDATFRGSVSRLINHSCDPSANAKIIKVNGQSKIVIYAERTLHPGEEILYDYKFPLESDPSLRVPCLCGAATCRGWLN